MKKNGEAIVSSDKDSTMVTRGLSSLWIQPKTPSNSKVHDFIIWICPGLVLCLMRVILYMSRKREIKQQGMEWIKSPIKEAIRPERYNQSSAVQKGIDKRSEDKRNR